MNNKILYPQPLCTPQRTPPKASSHLLVLSHLISLGLSLSSPTPKPRPPDTNPKPDQRQHTKLSLSQLQLNMSQLIVIRTS